jgi:hypothetical protein
MTVTWQDAAEVGLAVLPEQAARDAAVRCADRLPALADAIVENKVAGAARVRLAPYRGLAPVDQLLTLIDERRAAADQRMQTIPGLVDVIEEGAGTIDARWALMKGCSIRERYDDKRLRDVGDVDVWVPTARDAWQLSEFLLPLGYIYAPWELPWFKGMPAGDGLYGQVRVVRRELDRAAVDFHFGPYSVRHCGTMSLGRYANHLLAPEDDIVAVIGNGAGDCRFDLKSVNDLDVLLPVVDDVARVHALLEEGGLLPFLRGCLSRIRELNSLPASLHKQLDRLEPAEGPTEDVQVSAAAADRLRIAQTVAHSVDIALRDHSGHVREIVVSAADAYSYEHPLTVCPVPGLRIGRPVNWECVRLIPCDGDASGLVKQATARELEDSIRVLGLEQGDLVAVGDRIFVPTVDFRVSEELVGALAAHGLSFPDGA